ncbi:TMEM175 family protein [Streptomyces sp. I05A-00742]|uniref:TMEM175 family protein n=1 Tax=Streptomyces sp. I05A-00742 TaxID=2732853 RepID=UPI001489EEA4|nr:TMEM175 family protein [Streptomyces sp. I05A-00742]
MSGPARPAPGFSPERLAFFTDAIFAIAMTLLAVELERPEEKELASARTLASFLADHRSSYLAFALAFVLLWSVWRRHHELMDRIGGLSQAFTAWHAPFLLLVAFLPFPTAVVGASISNPLAQTLFASTMAAMVCCEAVLKDISSSTGLVTGDPAETHRRAADSWGVGLWFLLTVGVAWLFSYAFTLWFVAPLAATYGGALISRLRTAPANHPDPRDGDAPRS